MYFSGLNGVPPKICSSFNPWYRVIVILFGEKVFVDVINLRISRWDHPRLTDWILNPMTSIFIWDREGWKAIWQWSQDWSNATLGNTSSYQKMGEARKDSSLETLARALPYSALILDLWPPELWENMFLLKAIAFVVICYGSHRKLIQVCFKTNEDKLRKYLHR